MLSALKKAFHDSRRTTMWLSIGLGLYALMVMSFYPSIVEQSDEFNDLLQNYPEGMLAFFGVDDASQIDFSNAGFYIQGEFATWMIIIIGIVAIKQAFNAFTNAERDGSIEMMLSLPITRRDLLLARVINTAASILIVLTACFIAIAVSTQIWQEFDVSIGKLAIGIYGAFFPLMVVVNFTFLLSTFIPSSQRYAGPGAHLFFTGSYLFFSFSHVVDSLEVFQPFLLFDYYSADDLINNGADLQKWLIMVGVAALYFALAWWRVDEKELGV